MAEEIAKGTPTDAIEEKETPVVKTDWTKLDTNSDEDVYDESEDDSDDFVQDTTVEDSEEEEPDEGYLEVDFLKEKKKLSKKEAKQYAQKGLNYDHIKEKADRADALERELQELRQTIAQADVQKQKNELRQSLEAEGYDSDAVEAIITKHPAFIQVQKMLEMSQEESKKAQILRKRAAEKEALKDQPYFKELETEVDRMAQAKGYENVAVETIYDLLLGTNLRKGKLAELVSKAKKSAVADLQDSARRTRTIKNDNDLSDEVDISAQLDRESLEMSRLWKTDPKKIAKYVADQKKKKRG